MSPVIELLTQLIAVPSVTPTDQGCQEILIKRLENSGFAIERLPSGPVSNFWARRGNPSPLFVFAGHTDVIPAGALEQWDSEPFTATIKDGYLYGRGAADMKGGIAAMVVAYEQFIQKYPSHRGSMGFLITSGEEGNAFDHGTPVVMEHLDSQNITIDHCIVGEPSSNYRLGDTVRNGRRGSLTGSLIILGKQGHVAYPELADNPIHHCAPIIAALNNYQWDQGNAHFPPTTLQISNIQGGTGEANVIPGNVKLLFNFRFSSESTPEQLQEQVVTILKEHQTNYKLTWRLNGIPFLTPHGKLIDTCHDAIHQVTQHYPELSTGGGTSDGRFIAPYGIDVIELGLRNKTIHQVNECTSIDDLEQLTAIYYQILQRLLG